MKIHRRIKNQLQVKLMYMILLLIGLFTIGCGTSSYLQQTTPTLLPTSIPVAALASGDSEKNNNSDILTNTPTAIAFIPSPTPTSQPTATPTPAVTPKDSAPRFRHNETLVALETRFPGLAGTYLEYPNNSIVHIRVKRDSDSSDLQEAFATSFSWLNPKSVKTVDEMEIIEVSFETEEKLMEILPQYFLIPNTIEDIIFEVGDYDLTELSRWHDILLGALLHEGFFGAVVSFDLDEKESKLVIGSICPEGIDDDVRELVKSLDIPFNAVKIRQDWPDQIDDMLIPYRGVLTAIESPTGAIIFVPIPIPIATPTPTPTPTPPLICK